MARLDVPRLTSTYVDRDDISKKTNKLKASPVIAIPRRPAKVNRYIV